MSKREIINFIKQERYIKKGELENASPSKLKKELDDLKERAGRKLGKAARFAEKISKVKNEKNEIKDAADYLGEKAGEVSEKVGKKTSKALNKIESVTSGFVWALGRGEVKCD